MGPLPEEPVIPCLAKMLVPAPYTASAKKATWKAKGVRSGPRRKGASGATSEDRTRSSVAEDDDGEGEEESDSPLLGGERRGRPPQFWRRMRPRRGKDSLWAAPYGTSTAVWSGAPALSPGPHRKC